MSDVKEGLRYTKEHEWVKIEGENGRVGITDHAQDELTDIVFVEVPEVGRRVKRGDAIGAVESVKTVADVYSPVSGEIIEANSDLEDSPQLVNESPYEKGWIALIRMDDPAEVEKLMDAGEYKQLLGE